MTIKPKNNCDVTRVNDLLKASGDGILKIGRKLGIGTSVVQRVFKQEPRPSLQDTAASIGVLNERIGEGGACPLLPRKQTKRTHRARSEKCPAADMWSVVLLVRIKLARFARKVQN